MTAAAKPLAINRAYYKTHAEEFCRRTESVSMDAAYSAFLQLLLRGSHVLDAGCGSGRDAVAFLARGYHVTAVDASPAMVHAARSRGINARVIAFQRMSYRKDFDGIWACATLLHVPHAEIREVLRRFHRALRSKGVLYASLKEGRGEGIAADGRFFSYFGLDEFADLLTCEGLFKIIATWQSTDPDSTGAVRLWLNFLARKTD